MVSLSCFPSNLNYPFNRNRMTDDAFNQDSYGFVNEFLSMHLRHSLLTYTDTHTHTYIYIYAYAILNVYMYVCEFDISYTCIVVWVSENTGKLIVGLRGTMGLTTHGIPWKWVGHLHDNDVMACKCSVRYWPFVKGVHRWPEDSRLKRPVMRKFCVFAFVDWASCWTNGWVAGDLRHLNAHEMSLLSYTVFGWGFALPMYVLILNKWKYSIVQRYQHFDALQWSHIIVKESQITCHSIVWSAACSVYHQNNTKALHYCPFVRGIHRWPVDSPHKGTVMRKTFLCHDVIMKVHVRQYIIVLDS